ncbi:MAG: hypothetical protein ACXWPM_05870, partial [Bdellovibrionota bacterium]
MESSREWKLRAELGSSDAEVQKRIENLRAETGLSTATLRVCLMRGLDSARAIDEFLNPKFEA